MKDRESNVPARRPGMVFLKKKMCWLEYSGLDEVPEREAGKFVGQYSAHIAERVADVHGVGVVRTERRHLLFEGFNLALPVACSARVDLTLTGGAPHDPEADPDTPNKNRDPHRHLVGQSDREGSWSNDRDNDRDCQRNDDLARPAAEIFTKPLSPPAHSTISLHSGIRDSLPARADAQFAAEHSRLSQIVEFASTMRAWDGS
jgi:hypothetical protein